MYSCVIHELALVARCEIDRNETRRGVEIENAREKTCRGEETLAGKTRGADPRRTGEYPGVPRDARTPNGLPPAGRLARVRRIIR